MSAADRLDQIDSGPGWFEVIHPSHATTHVVYVHEDGSLYFPEGTQVLNRHEFAFADMQGHAHRLVRSDALVAALRAVLGMHQPRWYSNGTKKVVICRACGDTPCATVRVIEKALS